MLRPTAGVNTFYAPASMYGTLRAMPRMPNIRIGSKFEKPPSLLGCFSESQYEQFVAMHQLDEKRIKALDFQAYVSASASFGVSLDPLLASLVKLRTASKNQNTDMQEAHLARGFVKQNFRFKNTAKVTATRAGGGDAPSSSSASANEGGVSVCRKDGSPIDPIALSMRIVAVSNSLKNNSADTSKRKAGIVDSLSYDFVGRPIGDLERVVLLVLTAIADIANQMLYGATVPPDALKAYGGACWPGLQYRSTAPSDKAERTGYFSLTEEGIANQALSFRSWVLKTTAENISATDNNTLQELLSEGITTMDRRAMIAASLANAAKDLGDFNIIPRLAEGANQTLAHFCAEKTIVAELPRILAPVGNDHVCVPPEFMTKYHEQLARGVVAVITFRVCDFAIKSQQLALSHILLCGAVPTGAANAGGATLSLMNNPDDYNKQMEQSVAFKLALQLSSANALEAGGEADDEDGVDDGALADAAAQAESAMAQAGPTDDLAGTVANAANAANAAIAAAPATAQPTLAPADTNAAAEESQSHEEPVADVVNVAPDDDDDDDGNQSDGSVRVEEQEPIPPPEQETKHRKQKRSQDAKSRKQKRTKRVVGSDDEADMDGNDGAE